MTKEQFIAIQQALSFTNVQMAAALGISVPMVGYIRSDKRNITARVQKRAINALNDKIVELQRLRLFIV